MIARVPEDGFIGFSYIRAFVAKPPASGDSKALRFPNAPLPEGISAGALCSGPRTDLATRLNLREDETRDLRCVQNEAALVRCQSGQFGIWKEYMS
jgi:hypothetical protein